MDLAELFIRELNGNFTESSVKRAVDLCNRDMIHKMGTFEDEQKLERTFFTRKSNQRKVTEQFKELMEFWKVFRTYEGILSAEEKENYLILRTVEEVRGMYQSIKNELLLAKMNPEGRQNLKALCREIENISNSKSVKFLMLEKNGLRVTREMTLEEFEEQLLSINYVAVQNQLIEMMQRRGLAIISAGSTGLTPRRFYGFVLEKNSWSPCPPNILNLLKDTVSV